MSAASDNEPASADLRERLLRQIGDGVPPRQVLYVAAKLRLADALADGPRDAAALAAAVGAHPESLHRLLHALVTVDVVAEDEAGRFALTPTGRLLRGGVSGSLRGDLIVETEQELAWGALLHTVQTGETAFDHLFGQGVFDHFAQEPDTRDAFHRGMAAGVRETAAAIAATYPFPTTGTVVDIGGGYGALLIPVLQTFPELRGVLFDTPQVVEGARDSLAAAGVAGRCDWAAGDFFDVVPSGGDIYLLYRIIHDWDDTRAVQILATCRRAIGAAAKLLLIEKIRPERAADGAGAVRLDLNMMVWTGGRQRTEREYRDLLEQCSFRVTRVIPADEETSVVEALPV